MEKHLGKIQIAGQEYPLNYSIRASRLILETPQVDQEEGTLQDIFEYNLKVISILISEGVEFAKRFNGKELQAPTLDDLNTYFSPNDNGELSQAINDAITNGGKREIKTKPGKNGEAAQETEKAD